MSKVKVRDSALNAIKRYIKISKNDTLALDREAAETYLQLLEEQWLRFADAQQEVELLCGEENAPVEEQSRIQAEEWYTTAKANFKRLNTSHELPRPSSSTSFQSSPVQLPKLQLPTFSGDPTNWLAFFDAFQSLVHNNASLSGSQKLHYLRNCLQGEALQLVSSLQICDANYSAAWDLLTTRYKVLRVMVDGHFKAIFAIEKAARDTGKAIKQVLNATMQHVGSLRALGRPVDFWDDWLVHITVSKLGYETRKQWELSLVKDVLPTFDELVEFLETRARSLEMVPTSGMASTTAQGARQLSKAAVKPTTNVLHAVGEQQTLPSNPVDAVNSLPSCFHCNAKHKIYACQAFRKLNVATRFILVKKHNACLNCLSKGHFQAKCRSLSTCNICRRRHHTLLHGSREEDTTSNELNVHASPFVKQQGNLLVQQSTTPSTLDGATTAPIDNSFSDATHSGCIASHIAEADNAILLATAEIYLQDHAGRWQPARVLFDNGSHASFVTEACIQRLRLPRKPSAAHVTGIGSLDGGKVKGETTLSLASRSLDQHFTINSLILTKITNDLPTVGVQMSSWSHLQNLALADRRYAKPGPIDVLIGMDEMDKFLLTGLCKGPPGTPMAQNTVFGWVLFGKAMRSSTPSTGVLSLHCDGQLVRMVSKFWELEEFPSKRYLTAEEEACETHFRKHCRRAEDGRYIVRLPLKESVTLGESRNVSVNSLLRLEKRFAADDELRLQYAEFMQELVNMGHMELAGNAPLNKSYYMPHHAVVKNTSSTTKLRVVFNASSKTSSGFSLNDALMIGPQLQEDLFSIIARFRTHRYAVMADVEKMYRQVYIAEEDVDYQRIVWRDAPTEPIRDYRMLRVTYGVAAASHLAVRSLHQSALDAGEVHKESSVVITRDFYMDDLLTGSSSIDKLMKLQNDVTIVLSTAGFELRKWATNCDELREKIPHASKQISHLFADGDEVRTLGTIWNTSDDCLSIAVNLTPPPAILTKRVFLSDSSKIFDPLGLIAPCTILSKIWLQRIWRAHVDWDEPVPADIAKEWLSHRQHLAKLTALKLNRWIGTGEIVDHAEYHVFTDASQRAYAAVLYCRTQLVDGTFRVVLVAARAKVAPLKSTTLPRLELCAAHLGAKLVKQIQLSFGCNMKRLYAWTDSTITLAWLQSHPSRWSTFVANRVAAVQEILAPECWRHVRSEHNPADCASRGLAPPDLLAHSLWWAGPSWLAENENQWQHQSAEDLESLAKRNPNISYELRTTKSASHLTQITEDWELLSRYHSYIKLKRVTAYALRFVENLRTTSNQRTTGALTSNEILHAENVLVKYVQTNAFPKEISSCRSNKQIPLRSHLIRLQPFLDAGGILRVGGRIKRALVSADVKHPIILPKNSLLAKLIIFDIHHSTLHAGPQIMQTVLQRRFWVLGSRNLVRAVYHKCVKCKRINRQPMGQVMSDLPSSRLTSSRCFLHSAVDFAGPYFIKFSKGRGAKSCKAYISSFICMSTGAMHLELVGDLSSPAFVAALSRFVNRRGYCQHIYSDNGTNFVGAERELYAAYRRCIRDEKLAVYLANKQVTWHFNPPSAPHMGGYWEAGVKRVKYHLKRALGSSLLTYEELATLLTEVEACVNSRPLYWHSANADDLEVLTPGHFLIGEPIKSLPEPDTENFSGTLHQRWQAVSAMRQHFWSRWRNEYLVNLQQRVKWFRPSPNLKEDDVVVIHDSNSPPTKWRLGRVIQCHPGADGLVRVVKLKTSEGELLRPIAKLTLLPTQNDIFTF